MFGVDLDKHKTILFDFYGVLSNDNFYDSTLLPERQPVHGWIQENVFGNKDLMRRWMRNELTSLQVNRIIAEKNGIDPMFMNQLFEQSVWDLKLHQGVLDAAIDFKRQGKKIGIVSDNADVFSRIIVPNHRLDKIFDFIVNSADHGLVKSDAGGRLFDIALDQAGGSYADAVLIDDIFGNVETFNRKGGQGVYYTSRDK